MKEFVLILSLGLGLYALFIMQSAYNLEAKLVLFGTVSILKVFSSHVDLQDWKDEVY